MRNMDLHKYDSIQTLDSYLCDDLYKYELRR